MKKSNNFKEFLRKLMVSLKKNPTIIPLGMLIVSFLVFSLNLTHISNTTARLQAPGMGLCEFISMLLSLLSMICLLNAFPKRQKANIPMVILSILFQVIIIVADAIYIGSIATSKTPITSSTMFIYTAHIIIVIHIVLTAITAATIILEPLFAKLLKKINTRVDLEETNVANIELADEE